MYTSSTVMSGEKVFEDHVTDIHHLPFPDIYRDFPVFSCRWFCSVCESTSPPKPTTTASATIYARNWFYIFPARYQEFFLFFF